MTHSSAHPTPPDQGFASKLAVGYVVTGACIDVFYAMFMHCFIMLTSAGRVHGVSLRHRAATTHDDVRQRTAGIVPRDDGGALH